MPVYVDPLMHHGGSATFRWHESCHMYADTIEELHIFARSIGLRTAWFQNKRVPHYDLNRSRHAAAIRAGAVQHDRRQAVDFWVIQGWHSKKLQQMEFEDESALPSITPEATLFPE